MALSLQNDRLFRHRPPGFPSSAGDSFVLLLPLYGPTKSFLVILSQSQDMRRTVR